MLLIEKKSKNQYRALFGFNSCQLTICLGKKEVDEKKKKKKKEKKRKKKKKKRKKKTKKK